MVVGVWCVWCVCVACVCVCLCVYVCCFSCLIAFRVRLLQTPSVAACADSLSIFISKVLGSQVHESGCDFYSFIFAMHRLHKRFLFCLAQILLYNCHPICFFCFRFFQFLFFSFSSSSSVLLLVIASLNMWPASESWC